MGVRLALGRAAMGGMLATALAAGGCKWEIPNDSNVEMAPLVRIAEVGPQPADGRTQVAAAPAGGRVAYVRATPDAADREREHVFIDVEGRTWEVFGLPHEGKALENVHWEGDDDHALVVDRWYTQTQGVRVYIDVRTGSVFYAMPLDRPGPTTGAASGPATGPGR